MNNQNDSGAFDHLEQSWIEEQRKRLEGFDILRPVIKGEKKYQDVIGDFERLFTGVKDERD